MDTTWIWQLLLQLVLIALNAVFACAEIAVIQFNDTKLSKLAAEGDKRAIKLEKLTALPARFLSTIQVAITLAGFFGSAFAAENFSGMLVSLLQKIPALSSPEIAGALDTVAVILITIILSYVTLVFGELVPKQVAMRKAEKIALGMAGFITTVATVFSPLVWLLTVSTNGTLRLIGIDPNAVDDTVGEEEIKMMVDAGSEKGTIDDDEKEMIKNIFEFDDLSVGEIATHRTDVSLLWTEESTEQWEATINDTRHSVYPICDESVDNVVGVLKVKDYFALSDKSRENVMEKAVRPANFVLESVRADVLFKNMQKMRNHFAVVLDEYGGMQGIITMNDLLEQLVGELEDDDCAAPEENTIEKVDSGTWRTNGNVSLDELAGELGIEIKSDEYDTLSGLVFNTYGSIPEDGCEFEIETDDIKVKVLEIKDHIVERALVCLVEKPVENDSKE